MGWGWGVAWQVWVVVGGVENGKVGWFGVGCCVVGHGVSLGVCCG